MKTQILVQWLATFALLLTLGTGTAISQQLGNGFAKQTIVDQSVTNVDVIVGSARLLKFNYKIPQLLVENPEIINATAVSPTEILVTGLRPGLSTITVSDPQQNLQALTIQVTIDTRKLETAINRTFPDSNVQVHTLQTGVVLKGTVTRTDHIDNVIAISKDFFPTTVINELNVDSGQLVSIRVKVYEVNRTKLKTLGIDWALFGSDFGLASSISDIIQGVSVSGGSFGTTGEETISFGVFSGDTSFFYFMEALEQHNVAKLLDQPTLVAQNGRPAEFLSGGEIPIAVASGLGTTSIEFKPFGTKLDMVPIVHGLGELTLEVRAEVSEIDTSLTLGTGVPGFRVRRVNTGVRMKSGHTLALAGDYREETETEKRGLPFLMDSPIWGALFRRTSDTTQESELVFLITPRFASEVDPTMVPRLGPGQLTDSPSRHELYTRGYVEVPRCNDDCPIHDRFDDPANQSYPNYPAQLNQHQQNTEPGVPVQGTNYRQPGSGNPAPTGQFPVYQSNGSQPPANNGYGAGFGWPQGK